MRMHFINRSEVIRRCGRNICRNILKLSAGFPIFSVEATQCHMQCGTVRRLLKRKDKTGKRCATPVLLVGDRDLEAAESSVLYQGYDFSRAVNN